MRWFQHNDRKPLFNVYGLQRSVFYNRKQLFAERLLEKAQVYATLTKGTKAVRVVFSPWFHHFPFRENSAVRFSELMIFFFIFFAQDWLLLLNLMKTKNELSDLNKRRKFEVNRNQVDWFRTLSRKQFLKKF